MLEVILENLKLPDGWHIVKAGNANGIYRTPKGKDGYRPNSFRVYIENQDGTKHATVGLTWEEIEPGYCGAYPTP